MGALTGGNAYGWGFSPVNPVNGRRENRNRIPRALVGFNNALWVSGDQKYVDAWRNMIHAVNANARVNNGRVEYPTLYGAQGWYGWQTQPWDVGALEVWYWSMKPENLTLGEKTTPINAPLLTVQLDPGSGQRLVLQMNRYANPPTVLHPWHRPAELRRN